jgi:hypothetical protein
MRGHSARSTATPTTERLLAAFDNINLTIVPVAGQLHYQVTPLTVVQQRILALWELSEALYTSSPHKDPGACPERSRREKRACCWYAIVNVLFFTLFVGVCWSRRGLATSDCFAQTNGCPNLFFRNSPDLL